MYPSKTARNKDVITVINNLLRNKKISFSIADLKTNFNQRNNWCRTQIDLMLKYKLVKENEVLGINGEKIYTILDPKISHLIKRGEVSLEI